VLARWTVRGLILAGVACLAAGGVAAILVVRFLATAERAEGTVVANVGRVDRAAGDPQRSDASFRPVVRFTAGGRPVTFEGSRGSSPPRHRPGDRVEVLYPPGDPGAARLASFSGRWELPLMLAAIAAGLLATAALARQFAQKTWAESQSAA
jgi:hypothetical protein